MIAFVLGGGGLLGAVQVGMLRALVEAGVVPDLVLGTSVGAINGAAFAAQPDASAVEALTQLWQDLGRGRIFTEGLLGRAATLSRTGTHLHSSGPLRRLLESHARDRRIEDFSVRFECVAACVETARARWFDQGPVTEAVMSSCAVPGLLPPVLADGLHYVDGGLVDSVPVGRAVWAGADRIFVLQVGRLEQPLTVPRWPWQVGVMAFEIARRHRYAEVMGALPEGVEVVVLPSGAPRLATANVRYRSVSGLAERIDRAYEASRVHLAVHQPSDGR